MPKSNNEKDFCRKYRIDKMTEEDFIRFTLIFLHHFGTPMLPIMGYMDLLKKGEIKGSKEIYSKIIDNLKKVSEMRHEMVNVAELYFKENYGSSHSPGAKASPHPEKSAKSNK